MIIENKSVCFGIFLMILCSGCATGQSDFFPPDTRALDVFLVDKANGETKDVGRVPYAGGPGHRKTATQECKEIATDAAKARKLYDWDYYCCTVTPTNDCASKVKELY